MVKLYHVKMSVPLLKTNSAKEYVKWIPQMDAYSVYKEFSEVMKATKYAQLPDNEKEFKSDEETENYLKHTEEEKEALLKNQMAVTAFTMAFRECSDAHTMNMVIASKTKNWPSGQSRKIVADLLEEYVPTDLMGDAEQQKELEAISMRKYENPKMLFSQITSVESKYKGRASALTEKAKLIPT